MREQLSSGKAGRCAPPQTSACGWTDSPKERRLLFNLAGELAECQNLADWLKETPREAQ